MIRKEKAVMAAIDYQEKLLPVMSDREGLTDRSTRLLKGMKVLGVPVIFTQQYTKGLGMTSPDLFEAAGTDKYLEKIRFSAYSVLREVLPSPEDKPYVILSGIESHICVLQTAMELKEWGYQPVLVTDCMSSRKVRDHEMALCRAEQEGIWLTTYESILFEMLEEAGTAVSKEIQRIVK